MDSEARGSKLKRHVLTVKQRMEVLKDLKKASMTQVAEAHNIHIRTVFRIKKEAAKIAQFAERANGTDIIMRRKTKFPELEKQLYSWFVERRTSGDKLSDALLFQKACELQDSIASHSSRKVCFGWIHSFKKRNNIRQRASVDEVAAQSFISELEKQIEEEKIHLECIYNMNETGLLWKTLPEILAGNEKVYLSDNMDKKEKVTVALCANATGTHKLKPFFIHKNKKSKAIENITNHLPVIYALQKNAWMDQKLFLEWFSYFKESVRLFQFQEGICSKIILLLNNCESHKLPINYTDGINVEIKYLPPNITSLIQPMDQGIIEKTKQRFRHKLMQRVITYAGGITEFYKMYTIEDCIIMLTNAWADVPSNNIKHCWRKLLPYTRIHGEVKREGEKEEDKETCIVEEMQEIMSQLSPHNVGIEDVRNFLTVCLEEERNQNKNECRNENMVQCKREEDVAIALPTGGLSLNIQERQRVERIFTELEVFNDRASPELQELLKSFKLMYLGTS